MPEIMTVKGPITPDKLGLTSMHEHILCDGRFYRRRNMHLLPPEDQLMTRPDDQVTLENRIYLKHCFYSSWDGTSMKDEEVITAEMTDFKASGGSAMVDMTVPGHRCDISGTKRISDKTGVHVITSTGLYTEDSWPDQFKTMSVKEYEEYMLSEIENGIEDTEIRAGHIKVAFEKAPTEQEVKLLKAAVRVSNETGMLTTIHKGTLMTADDVRQMIKVLFDQGMNPERTVICHMQDFLVPWDLKTLVQDPLSWRLNLDFNKELLDQGFNASHDCLGHDYDFELNGYINQTDWQRMAGIYALCCEGYSSQIVLGTDTFIIILTRRFGGEGYCRLTKGIIPMLRMAELPEEQIRQMTVENPARLLAR
ncbi:phosphotriesterase [Thermodesulfobacteriota bacterium]